MGKRIAVQFGAGNIGRGLMGQLFQESAFETTLVDANASLVQHLNERGSYPLRVLDAYSRTAHELTIDHFQAVSTDQTDVIVETIARACIVATAVGVANLEAISPLLAVGIHWRFAHGAKPMDIYLCENMLGAAALCYDYLEDVHAIRLQTMIQQQGVREALRQTSGVDPVGDFGQRVIAQYQHLRDAKAGRGE